MAYYILKSYRLKLSPAAIFRVIAGGENRFCLDSSLNNHYSGRPACPAGQACLPAGRYSFFGRDPFYILKANNQLPFEKLRSLLNEYQLSGVKNAPPFLGGAVGFIGYDLGFLLEDRLCKYKEDTLGIPDSFFAFYNSAVIVDHLKGVLHIFSVGFPEKKYHLQKALCKENFKKIHKTLCYCEEGEARRSNHKDLRLLQSLALPRNDSGRASLKSNFTRQEYLWAVKKAKEYIKAGDIYQVNLSQRFSTDTSLSGLQIYQRLRNLSPSCFGAYFDAGDFQIISSSPERFLSYNGKIVVTQPMKGTRPRGRNKQEDACLKSALLKSPKDKAELAMIVDLERNDLGKVCDYASIKVNRMREIEKYATVYQATATIEGKLYKNKDRIDLLRACFPGGSITGCPKIRAMEIIEELEPHKRNIYTGCLGYLSFSGKMDFNILIRTILKKGNKAYFCAGGGIVADSNPQAEYQETMVKAKAMIEAIK